MAGATARALAFLRGAQQPSGEFRVFTSFRPDMADEGTPDPSVFPTAFILQSLSTAPGAETIRARAADFLAAQRGPGNLWRHWTRAHPHFHTLPADIDDSCCASMALRASGRDIATARALILGNRDREGRFLTWFIPRLRWQGRALSRLTARHYAHPLVLALFFRRTSAAPGDIDAGVNANVLHYLGGYPGHERVVSWLCDILRDRREADADKWYDNRFVLWYLFARALVPLSREAPALLLARLGDAAPETALDRALALSTRRLCGGAVAAGEIDALLSLQAGDGSWPRAAVYFGGRERRRDGTLAPPHPDTPRWGSEELTTGFCVEALTRCGHPCR